MGFFFGFSDGHAGNGRLFRFSVWGHQKSEMGPPKMENSKIFPTDRLPWGIQKPQISAFISFIHVAIYAFFF
jgi:hypothetical protein